MSIPSNCQTFPPPEYQVEQTLESKIHCLGKTPEWKKKEKKKKNAMVWIFVSLYKGDDNSTIWVLWIVNEFI